MRWCKLKCLNKIVLEFLVSIGVIISDINKSSIKFKKMQVAKKKNEFCDKIIHICGENLN